MKETIIAPVTRREAIERIAELQNHITDICDIIYYQEPLRIQDRWLKVMTEKGLYNPNEEEE